MDGMDDVTRAGATGLRDKNSDVDTVKGLASQHTTVILRETSCRTTSFFSLDESMPSSSN